MACTWNGQNVKNLTDEELDAVAQSVIKKPDEPSLVKRGMSAVSKAISDYVNERDAARRLDDTLGTDPEKVQFKQVFQNLNGSRARAQYFLSEGTISDPVNFTKSGDASVEAAYRMAAKAGGTKDGMLRYQVALQQLQDHARGLPVAMPEPVAMEIVTRGHSKYAAATKYLNREVFDKLLDYERNAGMYSKEQTDAMIRDNPYYIKQKRDIEGGTTAGGGGRGVKARTMAKKEGSVRDIVEPAKATVEAIASRIENADKNMALRALVGQDPRIVTEMGITKLGDVADLKVSGPATRNQFDVLENGKRTRYELADGPDQAALAQMIHGAAPVEVGVMGQIVNFFAKVKRSGITSMADFLLRGLIRDSITAPILNKHGGLPFQRLLAGVYHSVFRGTGVMDEYFRSGGFGAALNEMDVNYFEKGVDKIFKETGTWNRVINAVPDAWTAWQQVATRIDSLNRIGQYAALRKKGQAPLKAAMGSRDYTLDFATRGASGALQRLAAATPFLRPTILGTAQMVGAFTKRPVSTTAKAALYITAPSLLLYALNEMADEHLDEKDRYSAIPRWQRDLFWITPPIGDGGPRLRIPKPFVLGQVFGSLPERALEHMKTNDPKAWKGWFDNFMGTLALPMIPAAIEPVVEQAFDKDTMNFRPLIPASLEDNSGYMQYSPNTSATAVELARYLGPPGTGLANVSPIVLENYVVSWAGSMGNAVLSIVDTAFEPANTVKELSDNPFIKGLIVRENDMGTPVIEDFYDNVERITAKRRDLKLAIERQDPNEIDFTQDDPEAMIQVSRMQTVMGKHQSAIRGIRYDKEMTVDEKRQEIEKLYVNMREIAKAGNEIMEGK